jgi:hypothetical protein
MKQEFDFILDEKVTIWSRKKFSIEAETKEEAEKLAKEMVMNDSDEIDFYHQDFVYESEELIDPSNNNGQSTIVLMQNSGKNSKIIYENDFRLPKT